AVAPDGVGGVYVCGQTEGSLGGPSAGGRDAWLVRYDAHGAPRWIRQYGSSAWEHAEALAPDGQGGVFVCGYTHGALGGPPAGGSDAWVARYDDTGVRLWVRQLGSSAADVAGFAAPDGAGGVFVGGPTAGDLGGPFAGGFFDAWLARYDAAGAQLWIRKYSTPDWDYPYAAAPD